MLQTGSVPIDSEIQAYQRQYGVAGAVPTSDSDQNSGSPDVNASRMNQIDANYVRVIYYTDDSGIQSFYTMDLFIIKVCH